MQMEQVIRLLAELTFRFIVTRLIFRKLLMGLIQTIVPLK